MYIWWAKLICFWFEVQLICRDRSLAPANAGINMAAKIAIIAITTNNSIKVKYLFIGVLLSLGVRDLTARF